MDLKKKVTDKIAELGVKDAAAFFGVSIGTVSNWSTGRTSPSIDALSLVLSERDLAALGGQPDELVQWKGRKLFVGLPVYRTIHPKNHYTLFANYAKYGPEKIAMQIIERTLIHEARNQFADKFLNKFDGDTLLLIDDDMVLPCGSAEYINGNCRANLPVDMAGQVAFSRIMSHSDDIGIVGMLYFGRSGTGKAQCSSAFQSEDENVKLHAHHYRGLKQEGWVGTGAIRIKKWVLEKMRAHVDAGNWPEIMKLRDDSPYGFFTPTKVGVGEDVSFCRRAQEIGIPSYVDTSLECLHMGDIPYCSTNTKTKQ